ncbi:hypothetical protein HMPREF0321_1962 [Dermacoccus sp. Ellin185]|nr:hypothetical protein HMPREF0321_1962 [Dermacoccus sp. Ellin185]
MALASSTVVRCHLPNLDPPSHLGRRALRIFAKGDVASGSQCDA